MQSLNTYGYRENEYMKPFNYSVTISENDHIITVEDDGALLARLGLELIDSVLYLKGYDDVVIAQTDIPLSTGIEDIRYDKISHVITFIIKKTDGSTEPYDIDISDLVDLYQEGNGIEINEDENGNKTINVKINDNDKDILIADENGLSINLSEYVTKTDLSDVLSPINEGLENEIERAKGEEVSLGEKIDSEIERAKEEENSLLEKIKAEIERAIEQENILTTIKADKDEIPTLVSQLENDALYITLEDIDFNVYATKAELGQTNERIGVVNDNLVTAVDNINNAINDTNTNLIAVNTNLTAAISGEVARAKEVENNIQEQVNEIASKYATVNDVENAKSWVNNNYATIQKAEEIENKIPTLVGQLENDAHYITLNDVDFTPYATKAEMTELSNVVNQKVDKVEGKGLSANDYSNADKAIVDGVGEQIHNLQVQDVHLADEINAANAEISSVRDDLSTKVSTTTFNEKVAEIGSEMANIKSSIPTVPTNVSAFVNDSGYLTSVNLNGYATESWVEGKNYLTEHQSLENFYTKNQVKDICVTEDEFGTYKSEMMSDIAARYAEKTALENYYTKEECDTINTTFATKVELTNGLASKITQVDATTIAQEVVDNKLLGYTPTSGISSMIEQETVKERDDAILSAKTYTDSVKVAVENDIDVKVSEGVNGLIPSINLNADELHILSKANNGQTYDVVSVMNGTANGVVDETYRLVHKLLDGFNENDLTKLNNALKELIK